MLFFQFIFRYFDRLACAWVNLNGDKKARSCRLGAFIERMLEHAIADLMTGRWTMTATSFLLSD